MATPKFTRQDRQLANYAYKQYLFEKYRVAFSKSRLCFLFRGQAFQLEALMQTLHQLEQDKRSLDRYVTALFIVTLSLVYWAVYALDAYLQSVQ